MASKFNSGSFALFLLRVIPSCMMITHGYPKLIGWSDKANTFADPLGIGSQLSLAGTVGAEFFCAILIVLGIGTRLAAIPLTFTMLVAALVVHGADPFQKKELGLLYAVVYIVLIFTGGGNLSLGNIFPRLRKFN